MTPATGHHVKPSSKYCAKNPLGKMSCSAFCKMKPFWVVPPTKKNRETCLCKLHENTKLVITKLEQLKALVDGCNSVSTCVKRIVCDTPTLASHEGDCVMCVHKVNQLHGKFDGEKVASWYQWLLINETRDIQDQLQTTKRNVKLEECGTVGDPVGVLLNTR